MFCTECGTVSTATAKFCNACGFGLTSSSPVAQVASISEAVTVAPADAVQYATFGRRIAAFLIDALAFNGISLVAAFLLVFAGTLMLDSFDSSDLNSFFVTAGLVGGWLYYAGLESSTHQATIGKAAVGIRVADAPGRRISFARATGRHFGKGLSLLTLGIGFLMAAFTKRHQTLHDLVAGCVVLRTQPTTAVLHSTQRLDANSIFSRHATVVLWAALLLTGVVGFAVWPFALGRKVESTTGALSPSSEGIYRQWLAALRTRTEPTPPTEERLLAEEQEVLSGLIGVRGREDPCAVLKSV